MNKTISYKESTAIAIQAMISAARKDEYADRKRKSGFLRINYTYEGKTVTTNYYKWNAKKQAYVLVPEMTVTMDNTNM